MKRRGGKGGGEWSKCYWLTEISSKAFSCSSNPMTDKLNRTRSKIEVHFSSFFTCAGTAGWTPSQCHHQSSSLAVSTVIKKLIDLQKEEEKKKLFSYSQFQVFTSYIFTTSHSCQHHSFASCWILPPQSWAPLSLPGWCLCTRPAGSHTDVLWFPH